VNDYIQYLPSFFSDIGKKSFNSYVGFYPYGNSIYLHMENHDHGSSFTRDIWDNIRDQNAIYSLKSTLNNSQYNDNWLLSQMQYAEWLWFTDNRALSGTYFRDANEFPMIMIPASDQIEITDSVSTSFYLRAFASKYIQLTGVSNKVVDAKIESDLEEISVILIDENQVYKPESEFSGVISEPLKNDTLVAVIINARETPESIGIKFKLIESFIEIDNLSVSALNGRNQLEWNSFYEILNEDWIIIRQNPDGFKKEIARIAGRSNSKKMVKYIYNDYNIETGLSYIYYLNNRFSNGNSTSVDSINITSKTPERISLLQNYPNPFNNKTRITIAAPADMNFELSIYDIIGKKVKTLFNNKLEKDENIQIEWDGTNDLNMNVSTGIFFAVLKSDNTYQIRKMVYIR